MPLKDLTPRLHEILGQWDFTKTDHKFSQAQINQIVNFITSVTNIFLQDRNDKDTPEQRNVKVNEVIDFLKLGNQIPLGVLAAASPDEKAAEKYLELLRILMENGATPNQIIDVLNAGPYDTEGGKKNFAEELVRNRKKQVIGYFQLLNKILDKDSHLASELYEYFFPNRGIIKDVSFFMYLISKNNQSEVFDIAFKFLERLHSLGIKSEQIQKLNAINPGYAKYLYPYFKANPAMLVKCLSKEFLNQKVVETLAGLKKLVPRYTQTLPEAEHRHITLQVKTQGSLLNYFMLIQRGIKKPDPESRTRGTIAEFNKHYDLFMGEERRDEYQLALAKEANCLDNAIRESLAIATPTPVIAEVGPTIFEAPAAAAAQVSIEVNQQPEAWYQEYLKNLQQAAEAKKLNHAEEARFRDPEMPPTYARIYPHYFVKEDSYDVPPPDLASCRTGYLRTGDLIYVQPPFNPEVIDHKNVEGANVHPPSTVVIPAAAATPQMLAEVYRSNVERECEEKLLQWKANPITTTVGTMFNQHKAVSEKEPEKKQAHALTG